MTATIVTARVVINRWLPHGMIDDKVHWAVYSVDDSDTVFTGVLGAALYGPALPVTPVDVVLKHCQCKDMIQVDT